MSLNKFAQKIADTELGTDQKLFEPRKPKEVDKVESKTNQEMRTEQNDRKISQNNQSTTHKLYNSPTPLVQLQESLLDEIRKVLMETGKEEMHPRFTMEEKKSFMKIIRDYEDKGFNKRRVNEVLITRIAVNYIIADYTCNGEKSLLATILASVLT